ncbi:MAG: hypothetical protein PHR18_02300 [Oscillospiraceae bacterium]|nr:hypothetical protein [Oscillospiraceae bacterium]MDD3832718.1 hypothetical protein [Oscillospiraceae bacterium]
MDDINQQGDNGSITSFPVDINRDEFVKFNFLVSKTTGFLRFKRSQMILLLMLGGFSLFAMLNEAIAQSKIDYISIFLTVVFILSGFFIFIGATYFIKKNAGRAYDQNMMGGQSYYGIITVYPDYIQKENDHTTTRLIFEDNAVYIEAEDMIVILSSHTPAIVIPGRCLTPEFCEGLRQAALSAIPIARQKVQSRIVPSATQPILPPEMTQVGQEWEQEEELSVEIDYKREEVVKIATDTAMRSFLKMLPVYSVISMLVAMYFGFQYGFITGIILYLVINAAFIGFRLLTPRVGAGRAFDNMQESATIMVKLKRPGIIINSRKNPRGVRLAWSSLTRAVERPDSVDFISHSTLLRIPKRCIKDFKELKDFVDSHYVSNKA